MLERMTKFGTILKPTLGEKDTLLILDSLNFEKYDAYLSYGSDT